MKIPDDSTTPKHSVIILSTTANFNTPFVIIDGQGEPAITPFLGQAKSTVDLLGRLSHFGWHAAGISHYPSGPSFTITLQYGPLEEVEYAILARTANKSLLHTPESVEPIETVLPTRQVNVVVINAFLEQNPEYDLVGTARSPQHEAIWLLRKTIAPVE